MRCVVRTSRHITLRVNADPACTQPATPPRAIACGGPALASTSPYTDAVCHHIRGVAVPHRWAR